MSLLSGKLRLVAGRALRYIGLRRFNGRLLGRKFKLPSGSRIDIRLSEPWMPRLVEGLFRLRRGAFVDVGVNLGQTLLIVAAIDSDRSYIGFEPNPICADYAERLIRSNGLNHYRLIPAGLANKTAVVTLDIFGKDGTDSSASVVPRFRPGQRVHARKDVIVVSPANLPPELLAETIAVVKIDVEGAEKEVLEGLLPFLRRDRPFVSLEILPAYTEENTSRLSRQASIEAMMAQLDYVIFRIVHSRSDLTLHQIERVGIHGDLTQCEYLLAPAESIVDISRELTVQG